MAKCIKCINVKKKHFLRFFYFVTFFLRFQRFFLFCQLFFNFYLFFFLAHVDLQDRAQSFVYRPATASQEITYDNCKIPLSTSSSSYLELRFKY